LTLKEQGIEFYDSLLLVRQEKIMSFYDKLDENPLGLYKTLIEFGESIKNQMEALVVELDSFSVETNAKKEIVKALVDYDTGNPDDLVLKQNDEIEVLRKENQKWFGRALKNGKEGYFPPSVAQSPPKKPVEEPKRRLASAPSMEFDSPVKMEGYLMKKGRNFDHWKNKYYKLRNKCLWYYKSAKDEKAVGHFSIVGAKIVSVPNYKKKENVFSVNCQGVERFLSAPSREEMEHWVNILNQENS